MNVTTLKHGKDIGADCLDHSYVHFGITFSVAVQKSRKDGLDLHRGSGHIECAGISAQQGFRAFADCFSMGQQCAALCQQLLALGCQNDSATDAVEKLEA